MDVRLTRVMVAQRKAMKVLIDEGHVTWPMSFSCTVVCSTEIHFFVELAVCVATQLNVALSFGHVLCLSDRMGTKSHLIPLQSDLNKRSDNANV